MTEGQEICYVLAPSAQLGREDMYNKNGCLVSAAATFSFLFDFHNQKNGTTQNYRETRNWREEAEKKNHQHYSSWHGSFYFLSVLHVFDMKPKRGAFELIVYKLGLYFPHCKAIIDARLFSVRPFLSKLGMTFAMSTWKSYILDGIIWIQWYVCVCVPTTIAEIFFISSSPCFFSGSGFLESLKMGAHKKYFSPITMYLSTLYVCTHIKCKKMSMYTREKKTRNRRKEPKSEPEWQNYCLLSYSTFIWQRDMLFLLSHLSISLPISNPAHFSHILLAFFPLAFIRCISILLSRFSLYSYLIPIGGGLRNL